MKVLIQEKDGTRTPIDPELISVDGTTLKELIAKVKSIGDDVGKNADKQSKGEKRLTDSVRQLAKDVDTIKAYLVKQGGLRK
jgi:hypothetical protein